MARPIPQVKDLVAQSGLTCGEPAMHRFDQLEDVLRGCPASPPVVDGYRERGRQPASGGELVALSLGAGHSVVGGDDVVVDAHRHVAVDRRLELDREEHMPGAPAEVDLPQEIGVGADQPGRDPLGREDFDSLEVECVGQAGVEEMPGQLVDCQGDGEQQLVGLVVSSGLRGAHGARQVWGGSGAPGSSCGAE